MPRARRESPSGDRLQKVLASQGLGSRRELDRLLDAGRIKVNGKVAVPGTRVVAGDRVQIDRGPAIKVGAGADTIRVLAYNKPVGRVTSRRDESGRRTVFEQIPRLRGGRWLNVGRLDINTGGLLLFTNSGELAHRLTHPSYRVDREYAVRVFGEVSDEMLARLREGVDIDGESMAFSDIVPGEGSGANTWYTCLVQSGRHREVRRLWESQGVRVSRLTRVRFGNVMLPTDLRAGKHVEIGGTLLSDLCALVGMRAAVNAEGQPRGRSRSTAGPAPRSTDRAARRPGRGRAR